jgi:Cu/Zn superoxide dismutase
VTGGARHPIFTSAGICPPAPKEEIVPRFRTVAVAAVAASLLLAPTAAYAHPNGQGDSGERTSSRSRLVMASNSDPVRDLQPTVTSAFDGANASVVMVGLRSSYFYLRVSDVHTAAAGQRFGAHLHTGPCVAGDGAAAGPHYNVQTLAGISPAVVNDETEVWLDFGVNGRGSAQSSTTVPFVPAGGERSIMIHAEPTMDNGMAGARVACLPFTID